MDIVTIIAVAIAVVVLFKLYSVLGTRTGHERPPRDMFGQNKVGRDEAGKEKSGGELLEFPKKLGAQKKENAQSSNDAVVVLPNRGFQDPILLPIYNADPSFDRDRFLEGAQKAYEIIVGAFAKGDRKALKPLLSEQMYSEFTEDIIEREGRNETMETYIIGIDKLEIVAAELKGKQAMITVRIHSQMSSMVKDADGNLIEGHEELVSPIIDNWVFSRNINARNPNWLLCETSSEAVEEEK